MSQSHNPFGSNYVPPESTTKGETSGTVPPSRGFGSANSMRGGFDALPKVEPEVKPRGDAQNSVTVKISDVPKTYEWSKVRDANPSAKVLIEFSDGSVFLLPESDSDAELLLKTMTLRKRAREGEEY